MKRLLALLAISFAIVALVGAPASAGAGPKVTARLAIDSTCLATVYVTWSGLTNPDYLYNINIELVGETDQTSGVPTESLNPGGTVKGKATRTIQGELRADGKQVNRVDIFIAGGPSDVAYKTAACIWPIAAS